MINNSNLRKADKEKNDEFYTQLSDIENELIHYKPYFKGKTILCNCDDPFESNFFKYFALNFNYFGLKRLICTCYDNSPVSYTQLSMLGVNENIIYPNDNRHAYKIEINEVSDFNNDGAVDLADVKFLLQNSKNSLVHLKGNGDFRSEECIELLKLADIVVTNPPFSLFREYLAQLVEYDKKFIIIGNKNIITYRDVFSLIKQNRMWIGHKSMSGSLYFEVFKPHNKFDIVKNGKRLTPINACWYTNLEISKRHERFVSYKNYNINEFQKYDNYNAINIDKTCDIPSDYNGYMGVPITFLDKYNPEQFELLGIMNTGEINAGIRYPNTPHGRPLVNGVEKYLRIIIRRK